MKKGTTKYSLLLQSIECIKKERDAGSHSELYFKYYKDSSSSYIRYPSTGNYSIQEGETWEFLKQILFTSELRIELWESDTGKDDCLGAVIITPPSLTGSLSFTTSDDAWNYCLTYSEGYPEIFHVALEEIYCEKKDSDPGSHSEIYLKYYTDGDPNVTRYPASGHYSITEGGTWDIDQHLSLRKSIQLQLWESDTGKDDFLGEITLYSPNYSGSISSLNGTQSFSDSNDDWDYRLSYAASTFEIMDFNPMLDNIVEAIGEMSDEGEQLNFDVRCSIPNDFGHIGNHLQGIVSLNIKRGKNADKVICYISGSGSDSGYILISDGSMNKDLTKCVAIHDYNHLGGMQIIGEYLVVAGEHKEDGDNVRSGILFFDITDPMNPVQRHDLFLDAGGKVCMSVGITKLNNRYILVFTKAESELYIYQSEEGSLNTLWPDNNFWSSPTRWKFDDATNLDSWAPDQNWNDYQGIGLLTQSDGTLNLIGFTNLREADPTADDLIDCYTLDLSVATEEMITKVASRHMDLHGGMQFPADIGVNFRYGSGLSFRSFQMPLGTFPDMTMLIWQASGRRIHKQKIFPIVTNYGLIKAQKVIL